MTDEKEITGVCVDIPTIIESAKADKAFKKAVCDLLAAQIEADLKEDEGKK